MNYIVMDLEWNQCPSGKSDEIKALPFEIIEIGAVRMDEEHHILDEFHEIVQPQVYKKLHFRTREIVNINTADFNQARTFPDVINDFLAWCGEEPLFCTWGPADLPELQRNLSYYKIKYRFPFPLLYFDIQKIFSIAYEDRKTRRSLEYAADFLNIPKTIPFHSALSDATYTALVLQHLDHADITQNSSVDYFRTPVYRRQEFTIRYGHYTKFVSKPFVNKALAMKDRVVVSTPCFLCDKKAPKKIRWFSAGSSNYICVALCPEHGYVKGKIRLRQKANGAIYAVKTLKMISEEDVSMIREKKERIKAKRKGHAEQSRQV